MEERKNNTIRIPTFIAILTTGVIVTPVNYTIIINIGC